jgi:signal transduction histidine kinase
MGQFRMQSNIIAHDEKDKRVSELVIAIAVKDQFLTSMSHESRTPLNAIIGLSEVLVSDTTMIRSSKESEYIAAINSSGEHLSSLIGDILDLSKLNAGARNLEKSHLLYCNSWRSVETRSLLHVRIRGSA